MAKFAIECPACGRYAHARTGLFAKKHITCDCGNMIHIRTNKLTSRECEHCHNVVLIDQSEGRDARCPVCHKVINRTVDKRMIEFPCEQCGVRLYARRKDETYTCPVCDHVNDVASQIKKEQVSLEGLASIIKYEGDNETLVWRHPLQDFNLGSQLIVHESQEAIFCRDGQALDLFGAGRYTLEPQQLPLLEKIYKLPTDTQGTFHSEVYFFNMATQMGIKWGTDTKVRLFDPPTGLHVELGASGECSVRITNARKLMLKLVGTTSGLNHEQLLGGNKGVFRTLVMTQVKTYLAQTIKENHISVLEIDAYLMQLSEALRARINEKLDEYGLIMPEFYVARVVTPDEDPNFRRMKEQHAEQYLGVRQEQIRRDIAEAEAQRKAVEAQTAAQMKIIGAQGDAEVIRLKAMAEAEAYRAKALAEADEMRAKGYTYQQETARQVSMQAMQNGLTGHEGSAMGGMLGGIGEIAGLGMTLGAMGGVMNMTKDAMAPMMGMANQMGQTVTDSMGMVSGAVATGGAINGANTGWDCACGCKGISSKFCPECGAKKPEPIVGWTCPACGQQNITSKFCPECGAKKPEAPAGWDCPACGQKNIVTKFCPECGAKKPEPTWNCPECGQTGIKTNFCPECGHRKGV